MTMKGSERMPLAEAYLCQGCWDQMHMPVPIRGPRELQLKGIEHPVSAYVVEALGR
jgi:hypothetical protein